MDVDAPVATYLPEFGVNGKESVTVAQLLTHTSGLVSWLPLWSAYPDVPSRIKAVMDVAPHNPPGSTYEYSDLNLITLGVLVERLTGKTLDEVVAERITEPLRMVDTGYNPPASKLDRIAATEFEADPAARHGPRLGARRERLVARRRRRARRRVLHGRRHGGAGPDDPQRRHLPRAPDPARGDRARRC